MTTSGPSAPQPDQPPQVHGTPPEQTAPGKPDNQVSPRSSLPAETVLPELAGAALQAPWRLEYLENIEVQDAQRAAAAKAGEPVSFMAAYWANPGADTANHVIVRTSHGLILLNGYPYANGHLLVCLGTAKPRLLDYTPAERARLWTLVDAATDLMELALQPQGINSGINQGRAGGAGVPTHLHVHLVPRWMGDTNFITTVGRIRVIPSALDAMARRYRAVWGQMAGRWEALLESGRD